MKPKFCKNDFLRLHHIWYKQKLDKSKLTMVINYGIKRNEDMKKKGKMNQGY